MRSRSVIVLAVVVAIIAAGFWIGSAVSERQECGYLSASACHALRESDEREWRARECRGRP